MPRDGGVVHQVGDDAFGLEHATIAVANAELERLRGLRCAREQHRKRRPKQRPIRFGDVVEKRSAGEVRGLVSEHVANRGARVLTVVSGVITRITSVEC